MNQATETRELFTLDIPGTLLRGTFHKPHSTVAGSKAVLTGQNSIGILFLNSLSLPRAATGDSSVYWADSFAECGYPCFRIDLPGLGDSEGNPPEDFLHFINSGGYAPAVSETTKELVRRFDLPGIVIMGHCAGAVSALFAAAVGEKCKGLILMDPYFHMPQAVRPKVRQGLTEWAYRSAVGGLLSNAFDRLKYFRLSLLGDAPPKNSNLHLLSCWKQVASVGLPVLILRAPGLKTEGAKPRVGEFDYFGYIQKLAGRKSHVATEFIEGTNHSFANQPGRIAVQRAAETWLNDFFPLAACDENASTRCSLENPMII